MNFLGWDFHQMNFSCVLARERKVLSVMNGLHWLINDEPWLVSGDRHMPCVLTFSELSFSKTLVLFRKNVHQSLATSQLHHSCLSGVAHHLGKHQSSP